MSRLQDECKMDEYLGIAEKYLLEINPADDYVMFVMADYLSEVEETKDGVKYYFLTNRYRKKPAKSPDGMFSETKIPNNLQLVKDKVTEYYN